MAAAHRSDASAKEQRALGREDPDASAKGPSHVGGLGESTHPERSPGNTPRGTGLVPISEVAHDANGKGTVTNWHLCNGCSASVGPATAESRRPRSRGLPGTGILGFGLRIPTTGHPQPLRRTRGRKPGTPSGGHGALGYELAGAASCSVQPDTARGASAPDAGIGTSPGRRSTSVDRQSGQGTARDRKPRSKHPSGQQIGADRAGTNGNHHVERLCARTAGRDVHVVPLGTALLRERAPVGSACTGSFGSQNAARRR